MVETWRMVWPTTAIIGLFMVLALLVSSCGVTGSDNPTPVSQDQYQKVNVQGTTCIIASNDYRDIAISCNWGDGG